ncbi:OmpA family protein [Tahibacter soli]|uniref:OmpA family protein n=1 Tax=Tahibacter soli TaxID=2983605 RepID=A0A9X3YLB8_9GAMM|nr:OmpA family protein [Tahibacter soli]MDC8014377.1 OmpA family protein [Tahibacter soli]
MPEVPLPRFAETARLTVAAPENERMEIIKIPFIFIIGLLSIIAGCQKSAKIDQIRNVEASFEFNQILFKSGRPRAGDSLADAVVSNIDEMKKLKANADLLRKIPAFQVEIRGTTDNVECAGLDCYDLSTRRARMIYDWLRRYEVPGESIYAFRGFATERPISDNKDEEERQRSRRVEFGLIRTSYGRTRSLIDNVKREELSE